MKKLLMLGSSYAAAEMVECAKSMGVYTITTDDMPYEKSRAKQVSDEYWMISVRELDILEEKCRQEGITAVLCGISEFCMDYVMALCKCLGLPCYATEDAWHYNRNKADFKKACKKVGAPVATDYYLTDALTDKELVAVQFPVVVKPVDQCSNKGISFCHNREELIEAYRYARSVSENGTIIVERMVRGEEFLALYAVADGEPALFGLVTSYVEPGAPSFCYMLTANITPHIRHYLDAVDAYARNVLKETGCKNGIAWLEFMHEKENGENYFIEMGHRLNGDLVFMPLAQVTGFDAVKWMVECALGIDHTTADLPKSQEAPYKACACAYMLWTRKAGTITKILGLEEIAALPGVHIVRNTLVEGDTIGQNRPLGNILFSAKDCNDMCAMIQRINQKAALLDENGENILLQYTDFESLKQRYEQSFAQ